MPTVVVESICRVQNAILPDVVVDGSSGALDSNNMTADDLTVTDGVAFLKDVRVLGNLVLEPALSNGIFGSNLAVTGSFNASGNLANMDIVINGLTIENGSLVLFEDFNQCVISGLLIGTQGSSGPTSGAGRVIIQDVIGFKISGVVMGAYRHGCYIEGSSYGEVDLVVFDPSQQTTGNSHGFYLYNNDNITVKGSVFGAHWVVNQPGYGWRVDSNNTNIHMDVHVIGALTGEFLNEAGTETTMVPRMGADSPDDGDVLTWDVAEGMYRPVPNDPGSGGGGGGATTLDELSDVDTTGVQDGQLIEWSSSLSMWVPVDPPAGGSGVGGVEELNDLIDVDLTGLQDDQILVYISSTGLWVPIDFPISVVGDLGDVDTTSVQDGDVLQYDAGLGEFVPVDPSILGLSGVGGGSGSGLWAPYRQLDTPFIGWDGELAGLSAVDVGGTQTLVEETGILSVVYEDQASQTVNSRLKAHSFSTGDKFTVPTRMIMRTLENFGMVGIVFSDGITSGANAFVAMLYLQSTGAFLFWQAFHGTLGSLASSTASVNPPYWLMPGPFFLSLEYTGANSFTAGYGLNGIQDLWTVNAAKTMTPTHIGVCWSAWNASSTNGIRQATFGPVVQVA